MLLNLIIHIQGCTLAISNSPEIPPSKGRSGKEVPIICPGQHGRMSLASFKNSSVEMIKFLAEVSREHIVVTYLH